MSATPDQQEEFNLYAYIKQLIDGNDVSVLLRVADEVVSVMDVLQFYMPTIKDVSTGLKLALALIRKFLPEGAFSRIYVDEQPTESGSYVAGAVALESGDVNTAGVAMFRIKPKTEGVRTYWAQEVPDTMTVEEAQNYDLSARSATPIKRAAGSAASPTPCPPSRASMSRLRPWAATTPARRSPAPLSSSKTIR